MLFYIILTTLLACGDSEDILPGCPALPGTSVGVSLVSFLPAVLGGFALLLVISLVVWRRFHRETSTLKERLLETEEEAERHRRVWEIDADDIHLGVAIGRGAFGEVFRGTWRGMEVAIKTVQGSWMSEAELQKELDHEASVLQAVRHANIVQFCGAGRLWNGTPFLVTELMEVGSLTGVLQAGPLAWATKVRFSLETARGMALVHSLGRIHRDLKSGNILVTRGVGHTMHCKVADFGTATLVGNAQRAIVEKGPGERLDERVHTMRTRGVGTPLWMAPEVLSSGKYSDSVDVYSMGIVMWEMASQQEPWPDLKGPFLCNTLLELLLTGARPPVDPAWPVGFCAVMQRCWQTEPAARPRFAELVDQLQDVGAYVGADELV